MKRYESLSIHFLLWILFLHGILPFALQKRTESKVQKLFKTDGASATGRSSYEQYTLGQVEDGGKIIYTYQYTQIFAEAQPEISLDFQYPDFKDGDDNNDDGGVADNIAATTITQIHLYVKTQDGSDTQAYITEGGIGEKNISLQIVASNTNLLNYILVIYGKAA